MPKIILYIAQSADGYIASGDGSVSWLDAFNTVDYGYDSFITSIDCVVMGSKTYEQVRTFGDYPYKEKTSYIYTKRQLQKPENADVRFIPVFSKKLYENLDPNTSIWLVGGAQIIQTFIQNNLISEYQIFTMPIILGSGIPLFLETKMQPLIFVSTKKYDNGAIQTTYTTGN